MAITVKSLVGLKYVTCVCVTCGYSEVSRSHSRVQGRIAMSKPQVSMVEKRGSVMCVTHASLTWTLSDKSGNEDVIALWSDQSLSRGREL